MSSAPSSRYHGTVIRAPSKSSLPPHLNRLIIQCSVEAISSRSVFTLALSGGSLASFLSTLHQTSAEEFNDIDLQFDRWHVVLADERCVPSTDDDSNMGLLRKEFFSTVPIPPNQIYGIDESLLSQGDTTNAAAAAAAAAAAEEVAKSYQDNAIRPVLKKSGGKLDLAVLGFGPDGHTCSLFPSHELLRERAELVSSLNDSPKPPPSRITLTFPVLNDSTRKVIFCGAGSSKASILKGVFDSVVESTRKGQAEEEKEAGEAITYKVTMKDPAPYPCGMVRPSVTGEDDGSKSLIWVVDADAMEGVPTSE